MFEEKLLTDLRQDDEHKVLGKVCNLYWVLFKKERKKCLQDINCSEE